MNEQERLELERLKQRQTQLQEQLASLSNEVKALELRLTAPVAPAAAAPPSVRSPGFSPPGAPEPAKAGTTNVAFRVVQPPPLPPVIETSFVRREEGAAPTAASVPPSSAPPPIAPAEVPSERSFEMRLGTYWMVRVGVVMLLSALAFFGYYAYERVIPRLGPGGKVGLLYLASFALLGVGGWFQRKGVKESLKNYGQVVFAGGLAAVYFTTYAAHHVVNLRVIASPVADGALLLGWAALIVWLADRRKSEVLALFAIGLAYYTSVITHIGMFTLYSNLLLTVTAVVFLVRNRWAALSFTSLVATYAGYAFWRFAQSGGLAQDRSWVAENFWPMNLFLLGYWAAFTAAVFLCNAEKFAGANRALFLSLNNGAFFGLVTVSLFQVRRDWFWGFALGLGAALVGLALLAARVLAAERVARNSYLTQGLVLVTVGFIAKFSGLQLALLLAAQSVVLVVFGQWRDSRVLRVGAFIVAGLAALWAVAGMRPFDRPTLVLGVGVGALLAFNAWWTGRHADAAHGEPARQTQTPDEAATNPPPHIGAHQSGDLLGLVRPQPLYFAAVALVVWLVVTWRNTSIQQFPLVLAGEALALTASIYFLRAREIALLGQGFLALAHLIWLGQFAARSVAVPWWSPVLLLGATLAVSHWWQRQSVLACDHRVRLPFQGVCALGVVGVLWGWLAHRLSPPAWLALSSGLALGLTAYAALTRAWLLAASGQLLLLLSIGQFARQVLTNEPPWAFALAPIFALAVLCLAAWQWLERHPEAKPRLREVLTQWGRVYRWLALVLALAWIHAYVPGRERLWVLTVLGLAAFAWAGWRRSAEALLFNAVLVGAGLIHFWLPGDRAASVYWPNLLAIALLLAQQQAARRLPERFRLDVAAHHAVVLVGGLSLWLLLSRWVRLESGGFYLTVSWSVLALALFVAGLALRERMYRWLGLGVLACALGRVALFDVWKLGTLYRILSFMALGVVLLVVSFLYTKYQEKLRQWL
jgi:hypothetical protein